MIPVKDYTSVRPILNTGTGEGKSHRMSNGNSLIGPDSTVDALLNVYARAAEVFIAHGMACVGCPLCGFHTLAEATAIYGQDLDAFMSELETCLSVKPAALSGKTQIPDTP